MPASGLTLRKRSSYAFIERNYVKAELERRSSVEPLVSVIVPVFNIDSYINCCLTSILNQTYQNIEVILIDDGSTDTSGSICDSWARNDTRVRVLHKSNRGVSAARNVGLEQAIGDIILFADGDDWLEEQLIAESVKALLDHQCDMVMYKYRYVSEDGKTSYPAPECRDFPAASCLTASKGLKELLKGHIQHAPWAYMTRRGVYVNNDVRFPVDMIVAEDRITTYRLAGASNKIALCNQELYNYRIRQGSAMRLASLKSMTDNVKSVQEAEQYIAQCFPELLDVVHNLLFSTYDEYLIGLYEIRSSMSHTQYKELRTEGMREVTSLVKEVRLRKMTRNNRVKYLLLRLNLIPILATIYCLRNKCPVPAGE